MGVSTTVLLVVGLILEEEVSTHGSFSPIQGILFDLDGTLYHALPLRVGILFLLLLYNCREPKTLLRKLRVILQYRKSQELLRKISLFPRNKQSQLALTAERTGESPSFVSDVVGEWFEMRPLPLLKWCRRRGVEKTLDLMQRSGLKLGVFSDYPPEKKLVALGLAKFISVSVCSTAPEVTGFKPYTDGFAIAARRMGVTDPSKILYIGDRPDVDGYGAAQAGMQPVILSGFSVRRTAEAYPTLGAFEDLLKRLNIQ